jgi:hypothetical protein
VATRDNLFRRGVIQHEGDLKCVLCDRGVESVVHLFVYCDVALQVWSRIISWLDIDWILPNNVVSLLNFVASAPGTKKK